VAGDRQACRTPRLSLSIAFRRNASAYLKGGSKTASHYQIVNKSYNIAENPTNCLDKFDSLSA